MLPPIDTFSLFCNTHISGPIFGSCGMMLERMAVRAVVTIQQFCLQACTLLRAFWASPLAMISDQDWRAGLPINRSERTLQDQTSDQGSMNAKSVPAVQVINRWCPRIFSISPRLR